MDGTDFGIWNSFKFTGGGYAAEDADCNNDGVVSAADKTVLIQFKGLLNCATRFEGDIDKDGDVDQTDEDLMDDLLP